MTISVYANLYFKFKTVKRHTVKALVLQQNNLLSENLNQ